MSNHNYNIFDAIMFNRVDLFNDLILLISDINMVDEYGESLLHEAISSQNYHFIDDLLDRNINVNNQNKDGNTALHYLAEPYDENDDTIHIITKLIEHNGDVNIRNKYGNTPLWTATFNSKGKYLSIVEVMIKFGADPYIKNNNGKAPIDLAIEWQVGVQKLHDEATQKTVNTLVSILDVEKKY